MALFLRSPEPESIVVGADSLEDFEQNRKNSPAPFLDQLEIVKNAAMMELERRKTSEPLRYLRLNAAVERFARHWCEEGVHMCLFCASNAIGKTHGTVGILGWTWWPDLVPQQYAWFAELIQVKRENWDPSFRICSTPKEVEETGSFQRSIRALWPPLRFSSEKQRKSFQSVFTIAATNLDGSPWKQVIGDVMTYEQAPTEFEGATRGIFIYNEPPPRAIRQACVQRTRMGGMETFPMTPLADAEWISDEIVDEAPNRPYIRVCGGDMEEACIEHGQNGHLAHERIQFLIGEMDEDEREARSKGKFMKLGGVLAWFYDEDKYRAQTTIKSNPLWPHFMAIDPGGFTKPWFILWGQIRPEPRNAIDILREWPNGSLGKSALFEHMRKPEMKLADYAKMIQEVEDELEIPRLYRREMTRILDKRFGHAKDVDGNSLRQQLSEKHGLDFQDSYSVPGEKSEIKHGIQNTRNYFNHDSVTNNPLIQIDPSCVNLHRALKRWAVDPKTNKPKDDTWKNGWDVLRYICSANLEFGDAPISDAEWNNRAGQPFYNVGGGYS